MNRSCHRLVVVFTLCPYPQVSMQHGEMAKELLNAIEALVPLWTIVCGWVSEHDHDSPEEAKAPLLSQLQVLVHKITLSCADACAECGAVDSVCSSSPTRSMIDVTVEHVTTVRCH